VKVLISCPVEVCGRLYAYVVCNSDEQESDVLNYISEVYTKIWNEVLICGNFDLNCVALGDAPNSLFLSLEKLYHLQDLDAVYSTDSIRLSNLMQLRYSALLPKVACEIITIPSTNYDYCFENAHSHIPKFNTIALGGTFDRLHNGHKKLLMLSASACSKRLIIGIMSDKLLQKKANSNLITNFDTRKLKVEEFLNIFAKNITTEIVQLDDPCGPTISEPDIDAIVVSSETIPGATKINEIRVNKGFLPLKVLVTSRNDVATLSSTFIRDRLKGDASA